ncbi:hypothetical protein, partial [Actinoplanes philippinensis]|uniref:hypothetical protein n=1 Tax=Actinoplanes philippinensis TaxID=35752 RepID=UPI0033EF91F6
MDTPSRRTEPSRPRHPASELPPAYLGLGALYLAALATSTVNLLSPLSWYEPAAEAARISFSVFGLIAAVRAARRPGRGHRRPATQDQGDELRSGVRVERLRPL